MWIFPLLGYIGVVLGFTFLTLSIASGLYYLSELVEEHSVLSKRVLTRLIELIIVIHLLLLIFDGFPLLLTLFSAASHIVYLANISQSFPSVRITNPVFILSCFLVVGNHFLWFRYFSNPPVPTDHPYSDAYRSGGLNGSPYDYSSTLLHGNLPTFTEISAFFGICVWMVPFSLFVSLSASDNVLPSTATVGNGDDGMGGAAAAKQYRAPGMAKMVFGSVKDYVGSGAEALGLYKRAPRNERMD